VLPPPVLPVPVRSEGKPLMAPVQPATATPQSAIHPPVRPSAIT